MVTKGQTAQYVHERQDTRLAHHNPFVVNLSLRLSKKFFLFRCHTRIHRFPVLYSGAASPYCVAFPLAREMAGQSS
jgi:hypothetical protein